MGFNQQYDVPGLFDFLTNTPEAGLRKMLVDNKAFTDVHLSLLMKVVRACDVAKFCEHVEKTDFPKVKLGPAEIKLKEKFWNDSFTWLATKGLLNPAQKKHAA
ncbi:MAG TPA: hypothetical protein VIG33_07305 [Pseudobdellovibrionaceae bacterium]|jgi:hypothetical protein